MTAAMALESGEVRLDETFDTGAPLEIGAQPSMMRMVKNAH